MGDTMSNTEVTDKLTITYMRKLHRWRMAFFGVIILLAGIVIGGASMMILVPQRLIGPPSGPEFQGLRMIPMLERDLGLTPEQSKKIKPILTENMEKLREIRMNARSEIGQVLEQMQKQISAVLTERQRQLWQEQLNRLQRELRPGGRRGNEMAGPPGGGMGMRPRRGNGRQGRFRRGPEQSEPGPFGPPPPVESNIPQSNLDSNSTSMNEKTTNEDL
jgi:Spy/CpxP family protein refolding chaperone